MRWTPFGCPGAVNKKHTLNEFDEATKIIDHMVPQLESDGYEVFVFTGTLSSKIAAINAGDFDLAIDLHLNAGGGRGCEVVHVPGSPKRGRQAALMSSVIASTLHLRDRGPKEGWYMGGSAPGTKPDAFVSQTNCMAFIPEPLFIDNDKEVEHWLVECRHSKIADALCLSINYTLLP